MQLPSFAKISSLICATLLLVAACNEPKPVPDKEVPRIFNGYHLLLDEIIRSKEGIFRGLELNANSKVIRSIEKIEPMESSPNRLYYEFSADSMTNYSVEYSLQNDSLEEISVQINTEDLDLGSYLFCDLKDYYTNKLPNPTEDKGYVVYNCFEGQRKPFVVSLSDNSSPSRGIINMVIYKDK